MARSGEAPRGTRVLTDVGSSWAIAKVASPMGAGLHFLGWDDHFLPRVARWLVEEAIESGIAGADGLLVVAPGTWSARRLRSLVSSAEPATALPRIIPVSQLVTALVDDRRVRADAATARFAMVAALQELDDDALRDLVGARTPKQDELHRWLSIAEDVERICSALAAGGRSSVVATWPEAAAALLTGAARRRFDAVASARTAVDAILLDVGRVHADTVRLDAAEARITCHGDVARIILVGTHALSRSNRMVLEHAGVELDALVRAPQAIQNGFDQLGCVDEAWWRDAHIELPADMIRVAGGPGDQARVVLEELEARGADLVADEVTIAVTEGPAVAPMRRQLAGNGVATRYAGGRPLVRDGCVGLLRAARDYLVDRDFPSLASLVRHPDVASILEIDGSLLTALDDYQQRYLPLDVPGTWLGRNGPALAALQDRVDRWLAQLADGQQRGPGAWADALSNLLLAAWGDEPFVRDDVRSTAIESVLGAVDRLRDLPDQIVAQVGGMGAATALEVVLSALELDSVRDPANPDAIELVGWLEAMHDDGPLLLVSGMSSEMVTGAEHAALPESLADLLGLETQRHRLARDAHGLSAMAAARREDGELLLVVARRSAEGDPLTPSPLLLRDPDTEVNARRILMLAAKHEDEAPRVPASIDGDVPGPGLSVPPPSEGAVITGLSVTAFRAYLACPYRFWLRYVQQLEPRGDALHELDPRLFGSLVHDVLEAFGSDKDIRDSTSASQISDFLDEVLDRLVALRHPPGSAPTLAIQAELARVRLRRFAQVQATHALQGWRIVASEEKAGEGLDVDGTDFQIRARIDRIDRHEDGRVLVLDYKTGSLGAERVHRDKASGEWLDLQLPLYWYMARRMGYGDHRVAVGYLVVGARDKDVKLDLPEWDESTLEEGVECARDVVRKIRGGVFGPMTNPAPRYFDEYSWICQDAGIVTVSEEEVEA